MPLFHSYSDFETQFEFYTKQKFKNMTLDTFESASSFRDWLEKNAENITFREPSGPINRDGVSSIVHLSGNKAYKYFVPDDTTMNTFTHLGSEEYKYITAVLRTELYQALVIETILRTAETRHPDDVKISTEYTVADHFLRIDQVFFAVETHGSTSGCGATPGGASRVQLGYITERLWPIVDKKFVYKDLKTVFEKLLLLGEKHQAWVIHGDVKLDNILVGGAGRTILFDFGLSFARIDFPNCSPLILYSCHKNMDASNAMHIDSMFLANEMELGIMDWCENPYEDVYRYMDESFKIEKYLP